MADAKNSSERGLDEERRYVRRVDLRAALVVAAVFNGILGVAFALTGYVVLAVAAQRGVLEQINSGLADLSTDRPLHVSTVRLGVAWTLIVITWTIAMTIVAGLAVVIFNSVLRLFGGVEIDLSNSRGDTVHFAPHAARARRWAEQSARKTAGAARKARNRVRVPALHLDTGATVFSDNDRAVQRPRRVAGTTATHRSRSKQQNSGARSTPRPR